MLTKIGKLLLDNTLPAFMPALGSNSNAVLPAKTCAGNAVYLRSNLASTSYNLITSALVEGSSVGFAVGTGTTAPTENDYTLETQITSNISGTASTSSAYDDTTFTYKTYYELTISNTGATDITINEIGRFVTAYTTTTKGGTTSGNNKSIMVDRTVLDTPVTIPAGESSIIRYTVILPNGTN